MRDNDSNSSQNSEQFTLMQHLHKGINNRTISSIESEAWNSRNQSQLNEIENNDQNIHRSQNNNFMAAEGIDDGSYEELSQQQEQQQQQQKEFQNRYANGQTQRKEQQYQQYQKIIYKENIYDKLTLSPIQKYQKYGRFPLKLVIHILLVILTTSQILYSSNTLSANSTEQYQQWFQLFYQEESNMNIKNQDFENKIIYYLSAEKLQIQLSKMFDEMNTNNQYRLQDVYFQEASANLNIFRNFPMKNNNLDLSYNIDITQGINDPYDLHTIEGIKQIFSQAQSFRIDITNVILIEQSLISCWEFHLSYIFYGGASIQSQLMTESTTCSDYLFNLAIQLHNEEYPDDGSDTNSIRQSELKRKRIINEMRESGNYNRTLSSKTATKNNKKSIFSSKRNKKGTQRLMQGKSVFASNSQHYDQEGNLYKSGNLLFEGFNTMIDVMTLACSIVSVILGFKYLFQISDVYINTLQSSTRQYLQHAVGNVLPLKSKNLLTLRRILAEQRPWHQLTFKDKMQYFDLWYLLIFIGNFFQAIGSIYLITLDSGSKFDQYTSSINWTIGIGCFCSWVSLLKYFEYSARLAVNLDVFKFAFPELFKVLIEFFPVFVSFMIVGMSSFGMSERFSDMSSTIVSLIGMVMADGINDTILDIQQNTVLPPFVAIIYAMLFVITFLLCVTNVMIGILEDGYTRNKYEVLYRKNIKQLTDEKQRTLLSQQMAQQQKYKIFATRDSFNCYDDDGPNYVSRRDRYHMQDFQLSPDSSPAYSYQQNLTLSPQNSNNFLMSPSTFNMSRTSPQSPINSYKANSSKALFQKKARQVELIVDAARKLQKSNKYVFVKNKKTQPNVKENEPKSLNLIEKEEDQDQNEGEEEKEDNSPTKSRTTGKFITIQSDLTLNEEEIQNIRKNRNEGDEEILISFGENINPIKQNKELTFNQQNELLLNEVDQKHISGDRDQQKVKANNRENKLHFEKEAFHKELNDIQVSDQIKKEILSELKSSYKQFKKLSLLNAQILNNMKYFNISEADQRSLRNKQASYLSYFQQRVQLRLMEMEHFKD